MRYRYIAARIAGFAFAVLGVLILIFFISRILPGDPVGLALGPSASKEEIEALRHAMALDQPLHVQFYIYLQGLAQGKFGLSLMTRRDALTDVINYFPATLELVVVAIIFGTVIGIFLGVFSALHRNSWLDSITRVSSIAGVALPRFWFAIILQLGVAYWLGLLPCFGRIELNVAPPTHITGLYILDSILTGNLRALVSSIRSIILPALVLSTSPMAQATALVRGNMIEEGTKEYVSQALASGLPRDLVTYRYMLKNAISPALTSVAMTFGWMLGNAFVVETVFSWPGIASYGKDAAIFKDVNGIVAVALVLVVIYLSINLVVDMVYSYLDPRVKYTA